MTVQWCTLLSAAVATLPTDTLLRGEVGAGALTLAG